MADPEWRQGRYLLEGTNPRRGLAVARMGAHITYLSDAALAPQVRPPVAGSRQSDLLVRCRFRGGVLSAPPGQLLRRALRRQLLSLPDAGDGLFRPRGGLRRRAGECFQAARQTRFCVVSFTSDWLFPTVGFARDRACAQCRRRARVLCRDHHRQGPRRFSARRAGAVCDRARLPRLRGQGARLDGEGDRCCTRLQARSHHGGCRRTPGSSARRSFGGRRR